MAAKTVLNPISLAKPSGYSHGLVTEGGRLLFLAGQTGIDASGGIVTPGDLIAQFTRALTNLQTVVQDAGGAMTDIVKLTIYVKDMRAYRANLKPIGAVYRSFFGKYYPAITLVRVSEFFDEEALIELDALAVLTPL